MNLILIASLHLDGVGLTIIYFFWSIKEEINKNQLVNKSVMIITLHTHYKYTLPHGLKSCFKLLIEIVLKT